MLNNRQNEQICCFPQQHETTGQLKYKIEGGKPNVRKDALYEFIYVIILFLDLSTVTWICSVCENSSNCIFMICVLLCVYVKLKSVKKKKDHAGCRRGNQL